MEIVVAAANVEGRLIMHEDAFFKLLNVENPVPASEVSHDKEENGSLPVIYGPRRKPGRKPLYEKYPRLVEMITNVIKQHSFSSHGRRRETSGTGSGVSLQAIRDHVVQELPELKDVTKWNPLLNGSSQERIPCCVKLQRLGKCTNSKDGQE